MLANTADTKTFLAMKHGGYYSNAAAGAEDVILGGFDLIQRSLDITLVEHDAKSFRCADFGCADGGTSLKMWARVFSSIAEKRPGIDLELFYDDLPNSDFNQLFRSVHGLTNFKSYLQEFPSVLTFASANSFHTQVLPEASLDFGFSALASHYLTKPPCNISNHIHMVGAEGEERANFQEQGKLDWERFLGSRAFELKRNGTLCVVNPGIDKDGHHLGNIGGVHLWNIFNDIWKKFVNDGVITETEYRSTNFPQHYRTVAECIEPVTDPRNAVFRSGLRLEHVETRIVRCPKARAFTEHRDVDRFVNEYVPSLRSWIEPTMLKGISLNRPSNERNSIIDKLFEQFTDHVKIKPDGHGFDYCDVYMICRRAYLPKAAARLNA